MSVPSNLAVLKTLTAPLLLSLLVACSSGTSGFPQIASPPPFDYVDGEELRSQMHQFAFELQQLDLSLSAAREPGNDMQQQVIRNLRNIERIGSDLRDGDMSSNHIFLQQDMSNFLASVNRARIGVEDNPPRYYLAGRVSGACVNCHQVSR